MKKLFTLTIMLITLAMNAQDYAHVSNPVVDVVIFKGLDALWPENAITVPDGYFLTFKDERLLEPGTRFREGGPTEFNIVPSSTALALRAISFFFNSENTFLNCVCS